MKKAKALVLCVILLLVVENRSRIAVGQAGTATQGSPQLLHGQTHHLVDGSSTGGRSLAFVENLGQFDNRVKFQASIGSKTLFLTDDALWLSVTEPMPKTDPFLEGGMIRAIDAKSETTRRVNLKLRFAGANPDLRLEPIERLETRVSFLTGNDPSAWVRDVRSWAGVRYANLYPGIDLEFSGRGGKLALMLVVREPSALEDVKLDIEGADNVVLERNYLRLTTPLDDVVFPLPVVEGTALQFESTVSAVGGVFKVSSPFTVVGSQVSNAKQDSTSSLFFSTYLGGSGHDMGNAIDLDNAGNVYIIGQTSSMDFPTTSGVYDRSYGGGTYDIFVSKLSRDGRMLLYSTYIGGSSEDGGDGIFVDIAGNAYITGKTYSPDFPTTEGAIDRELDGGRDAFVAKLSAAGDDLIYSSYLGGNSWDYGFCLTVDDAGNAYVGGFTHGNFPTTPGAAQVTFGGSGDGFATKVSPDGDVLLYSTYLGGYSWEGIQGIAVDKAGNVYLAADTHSTDFPTTPGAWDRVCDNCLTNISTDGAVAKLSADGSEFIYSTLIGGADASGTEALYDLAIDSAGNAYLVGSSSSTDYPTTPDALQSSISGGQYDVVVTKLNAAGSDLLYSTYLGGSGDERGYRIALDNDKNAYVTGFTNSTDLPTVNPLQAANAGGYDAFVARMNRDGSELLFSTYLGGKGNENIASFPNGNASIAFGDTSAIYIAGYTNSDDFPTTDAYDVSYNGGSADVFVTRLDLLPSIERKGFLPLILMQ
jgi:hypothetical protein